MLSRNAIRFYTKGNAGLRTILKKELEGIKAAGTYKTERVIIGPQGVTVKVQGRITKILLAPLPDEIEEKMIKTGSYQLGCQASIMG
ncbi:unnamed protein product [Strongylus vulgaris]|uniref:Uncharacterized protein n=1 Tax=Strongylus vulgaris TaxID=40348 RepID=A0A3P7JIC0_STRVU|nr:unnamed protein product [Strongylus vulgaris]